MTCQSSNPRPRKSRRMFFSALGPHRCQALPHCSWVSRMDEKSPTGTTGIGGPNVMKFARFVFIAAIVNLSLVPKL